MSCVWYYSLLDFLFQLSLIRALLVSLQVTEWVLENITEDKPSADNFRFLYDGKLLADKNIVLYELVRHALKPGVQM
jgi:hypothetical protein